MQDVNYQLFSDSVREEVLLGAAHTGTLRRGIGRRWGWPRSGRPPPHEPERRAEAARCGGRGHALRQADLIVLDEPTSGLDHAHMQQVGQLLQQLKQAGKIVLVITHDEELAADWCDRVIQWNDKEERGR